MLERINKWYSELHLLAGCFWEVFYGKNCGFYIQRIQKGVNIE